MMLPVSELHDFPGHPFQVRDDEEMEMWEEAVCYLTGAEVQLGDYREIEINFLSKI